MQDDQKLLDATNVVLTCARGDAERFMDTLPETQTVTSVQQLEVFVSLCCAYLFELSDIYIKRYGWESVEPYLVNVLKELDVCISVIADKSGSPLNFADRYELDSEGWRNNTSMIDPMTYIFLSVSKNYGESTVDIGQVVTRYTVFQKIVHHVIE